MSQNKSNNPFEKLDEEKNLSRKKFLKEIAAASASVSVLPSLLSSCASEAPILRPSPSPKLTGDFQDRFRKKYTWDDTVKGTHNLNCWFQQNCLFNVYLKDGKVIREEQVGDYPQTNPDVPDFNPRGCQKGCTYSELMYSEPRLTKPLKRAGKRGSGKWKEASWDEALEDIAKQIVENLRKHSPQSIFVDPGGNIVNYLSAYSMFRLFDLLDSTILDINCELGDDQQGAAVSFGEISADRSGDDYFYADLILVWGGNPAYTQIPNFHFLTEARYNGSEIVVISPDFNATAMHADLWIPVKPGTDSALANAMAYVMIEEGLYDRHLIQEQTDLPFLVRVDNRKLLRESDINEGGSDEILFRWDSKRKKLDSPGLRTLALEDVDPALEGRFRVQGKKGSIIVQPAFEFLKERLKAFTPEKASKICGVAPETIRMLARKLAKADRATNTCTSAMSKFYHGDLLMRSQILVFLLGGHLGRKGDGFVSTSFLVADGSNNLLYDMEQVKDVRMKYAFKYGPSFWKQYFKRKNAHYAAYKYGMEAFAPSRIMANSTLFWNIHGNLLDISGRSNEWDPHLKRNIREYLDESLSKDWQVLDPRRGETPKIFFSWAGNSLRRVRGAQKLIENLWPKLDLVVALEMRLSSTAMYADYVLPVSGAYEKTTTMFANSNTLIPYLHTTQKAVKNVGQSKDEWEIACLLAEKIQKVAKESNMPVVKSKHGKPRDLTRIHDYLTFEYEEKEAERITADFIEDSSNLGGISWRKFKKKGYAPFTGLGDAPANLGNACDINIKKGETISPHTWHRRDKEPWLTLSGRVQFYIDHDWYLELGEELPIHKDPPMSGGNYPLALTGGHARWSIHALWRTDPRLLRLQRGEPVLFVSPSDAKKRKVKDHDRIVVFNDIDSFTTRAKISHLVAPGQVIMYHAWESYQFEGWKSYRNVLASPLNPIEMVGDYPYLRPVMAVKQPGQSDRDTRVDFRKAK